MGFCSLHFEKHGEPSGGNLGNHIDRIPGREYSYRHADLSLTKNNKSLKEGYNKYCRMPYNDAIKERIKDGYKGSKAIRKDATYSVNTILSGSHEELKEIEKDPNKLKEWINANLRWCESTFGKDNIIRFTVHLDEKTPHIHCVWVPITAKGGLSAKEYIGDGKKLEQLQTSYANAMKPFGLERGVKSDRKHQTTDEYRRREALKLSNVGQLEEKIDSISKSNLLFGLNDIKKDLKAGVNSILLKQQENYNNELATYRGGMAGLREENERLKKELSKKRAADEIAAKKPKYIAPDEVQKIVEGVNVIDYFLHLAKCGKLVFSHAEKGGKEFLFTDPSGVDKISASEKGWRDFKADDGGQIVKAVMKYERLDWLEAINWLNSFQGGYNTEFSEIRQKTAQNNPALAENRYNITQIVPPSSPPLVNYFEGRGISLETLREYTKQIHYQLGDKHYYGIGMQNDKGNWEIRNPFMKTKFGVQGITEVGSPEAKKMIVVEGMTDLLSMIEILKSRNRDLKEYRLVSLNSVSNIMAFYQKHGTDRSLDISLCLDGDEAGESATQKLLKAMPNTKDVRSTFNIHSKGYKDLNECLKEQLKKHQEKEEQEQRRSKGIGRKH